MSGPSSRRAPVPERGFRCDPSIFDHVLDRRSTRPQGVHCASRSMASLTTRHSATRQIWTSRPAEVMAAATGLAMERSMSTEDDRPEEELTSGEHELGVLVDAIPTLVWRAAPDADFEYVNKRMLEYLGAPLSEVIGWGWMDKVHPDDVGFKVRSWLQNLKSGKPHDVVCRIRGVDGRYRWFEVRGEPLRASNGTVLSWYGVLIDIDDRRKAEEAVREGEYKEEGIWISRGGCPRFANRYMRRSRSEPRSWKYRKGGGGLSRPRR